MQDLLIQEVMTTNVYTVNCNESANIVAKIFDLHAFHHIIVVNDENSLKGIISSTDMDQTRSGMTLFRNPRKEAYDTAILSSLRASDIMTKDVIMLQATDSVRQAYEIFKKNKFRALPIVNKGRLVGIITPLDILHYFFK